MSSNWFRWFEKGVAVCLLFLGAMSPPAHAKEQPEIFYYLAVPSCPKKGECVLVACIQLNRQGIPVEEKAPTGKSGVAPFFSIWRSSYWEEKAPDASVKTVEEWKSALDAQAERAVAKKAALADVPAPLRGFFFELEKLRCSSLSQQIILQPLFKTEGFVGWEHVNHLDVLATATTVSAEDRSKALISSLREPKETDPAKGLIAALATLGVKPRSLRYWPEYNLFLIEADANFKKVIEVLFSPA